MGKKSKKKGGAANKAARKEKLQERREQQLEQLDRYDSDGGGSNEAVDNRRDREYFVGDRVWFKGDRAYYDENNPNSYRGLVHAVDGDFVEIKPLQALIDGIHYTERIPTKTKPPDKFYVFPDFCDMTLRFDVGDKVICKVCDCLIPASVCTFWPIGEFEVKGIPLPAAAVDRVPHYKCEKLLKDGYGPPCVPALKDCDSFIRRKPASFRFEVGDTVTFNSMRAWGNTAAASNQLQRCALEWTEGKIILVDVCEEGVDYAVYECSFKVAGKKYTCLIEKDDDEHIALIGAEPRRRLIEAIEQDCSRDHFNYLTRHFHIDVTAFRDLVVTKAIEFASYNALTWLQHDCSIDVTLLEDKDGNNFLHMIANSLNASRFISRVGDNSLYRESRDDVTLNFKEYDKPKFKGLNNNGEVWLQSLVRRGDVKALDIAFSPNSGLGWDWENYFDANVLKLVADSIKESNNPLMQYIFDAFVSFHTLHDLFRALSVTSGSLPLLNGEDAKNQVKLMTRFYRDWEDNPILKSERDAIACHLVGKGMLRLFQLVYEADGSFFETNYGAYSNQDTQQFIQTELRASTDESVTEFVTVNIFEMCILGTHHAYFFRPDDYDFELYRRSIFSHTRYCNAVDCCPSLLNHLAREKCVNKTQNPYVDARLRLLEDEGDVKERQNVLDYLFRRHTKTGVCILFPLRHRQCWALRFMVDNKYLDLEGLAAEEKNLAQNAPTLSFLNSGRFPSNMTVRCCLIFVAVQYDDLQSLEWLCESDGAPYDLVGGWNLLHYSAYMGRIEIISWLSTQPAWNALVSEAATRKPFCGASAVHIAASCGHLHACDLLICLKVPLEDVNGKLPESYAQKSQHDFVRKWAAERAKPQSLLRDVAKLISQVEEQKSVSQIMDYIISSKCLDIDTWQKCNRKTSHDKLGDLSFRDVIHLCCKNADIELVKSICVRLYFGSLNYSLKEFWDQDTALRDAKRLSRDDLVSFAKLRGYDDLVRYIQEKWFNDISCEDPLTHNSMLESSLGGNVYLVDVRAAILRLDVLANIVSDSNSAMADILMRGGKVDELAELFKINTASYETVMTEMGEILNDDYKSYYFERPFEMPKYICEWHYEDNHPVSKLLLYAEEQNHSFRGAHIVLASEGYTELLRFCLSNIPGWNAAMELNVVRIASFFGHTSIVEMLLNPEAVFNLHSDEIDRHNAAIVGLGEALRYRDLECLKKIPRDSIMDKGRGIERKFEGRSEYEDWQREMECTNQIMSESLIVAVLNSYATEIFDSDVDNKTALKTLRLLVDNRIYTHDEIIYAVKLLLAKGHTIEWKACILDLLQQIIVSLGLEPIFHPEQMQEIANKVTLLLDRRKDNEARAIKRILSFFAKLASAGIDIQRIGENLLYSEQSDFKTEVASLQQKQLTDWSRFDIVKKGGSLADIKNAIRDGSLTVNLRDRGGLLLTHLSAAYDRVDLLNWLVVSEGMDLNALDAQQRTTLEVAKASKASLTTKWIVEWKAKTIIGTFLRRNYYHAMHRRRLQQSNNAATVIQSAFRAYVTRKIYVNVLVRRLEESHQFTSIWGRVISSIGSVSTSTSWADIREQLIDIKVGLDDEMLNDTDQRLNRATNEAVEEEYIQRDDENVPDEIIDSEELASHDDVSNEAARQLDDRNQWLSFHMTSHVVKFLQQGDKKYRSFFVRRMRQLASGERSRILQKPLKGSKGLIYETYLEQRSGHRILWTEESGRLVIWYIAKHKQVSRLMQLIDDSKCRSARQQIPDSLVNELQHEGLLPQNEPKEVLLDIFGNVPLKIYDVDFNTISEIAKESWTPQLHLTDEERDIVEEEGTVLVLGRSGTGKTVTITQRLEFDRQSRAAQDPTFTQLFVARSVRLCRYVEGAVGEDNRTSFLTYATLLNDIESSLPGQKTRNFNPSQRIDFGRFKRDFHYNSPFNEKVSALISWTVIRTFLKGSMEAFQSPEGILSREEFVEVERLGKNRCKIPAEMREQIYDEFLQYQKYLKDLQLWDDCDRLCHLLLRINHSKKEDPDAFRQIQRSKIYVDEVQDYTQLEILLFFYLSGPNGLFLAGDPAQSVVEGTEFRFEEVRGVGHFVGSIIKKPKTVNVNFRSHSGILNCAGGVLDLMFTHFPSSAKQLKKDEGLFQGSRPGVLLGVSADQLSILLNDKLKGAVVLTHDESARYWRRLLNDYKLVYGIREAKGLEFKTVIILDFFGEIPSSLQKPWRELVLGRAQDDFERSYPLVATFLKLLYTGVTRCIEKLFFVESKTSTAGDATMRWLTKKVPDRASYATRNNINHVEAMSMTSDEFVSEGINNAELAQAMDLGQAQLLLERSIWCFEQTDVIELAAKARIHYSSILFRQELQPPSDEKSANDRAVIEMRAAQLIESLTKEGLFFEALNICSSVAPFLSEYAKEELDKRFIRKIRLVVRED